MLQKIINSVIGTKSEERNAELYRNLIRSEAKIGGDVFGPVPDGHRREFFCLDRHTWVWHEEWRNEYGQTQVRTTRYDVREDGLLKFQNGQYKRTSADETKRFKQAAQLYLGRVNQQMYSGLVA